MEKELRFLQPFLTGDTRLGLIGVGSFGSRIRNMALSMGIPPENLLLSDPGKCREQAEEINDALHSEWGNGMGGCYFSSEEFLTYLPLASLAKADIVTIQIPLTEENKGLIGREFLANASAGLKIISFSGMEVFSREVKGDPRILIPDL